MSTNLRIQTAIHIALGVSAGALAWSYMPNALAQDAEEDKEYSDLEEITVTGSRIKRQDIDTASPVTVITRAEIELTGLTDVGDILQRMPSMSGSPIGTTTNNGGNGSVTVDLRGMGVDRTLTLVNGQRVVDGGDFQTIPSTMIERIEILKDGASAVYGADAVAGVVNIITRRDFEGVEFNVQNADWFDSAGQQTSFGVIGGTQFEGGNFVFGAEYVDQEEAFQADVPWDFMKDSFYIYPEGCENQLTAPYDGTSSGGCYRIGSSAIPEGRWNFVGGSRFLIGTPASEPNQAGVPIRHDGRNYNYAPVNYLQTPYKRKNIFAEGHFDVTDNVRFNAEFRGNSRESAQELAPTPYFSINDPAYNGVFNGVAYHGASQDNYYLRQAVDNYNAANPGLAPLPYAPATDIRRRMFEQPRRFEQEITQWQFVTGLEGTFAEDVYWDAWINHGVREREDQDFGQYVGDRLANALGPSADLDGDGQPECYLDVSDPSSLITGCVPLNLWGGGTITRETGQPTASSVTPDMLQYISFTLNDSFVWKNTSAGASLTSTWFDLPGGKMGWAVGYGYWKQEFKFTPDSGKAAGNVTGNKSTATQGTLTNNNVFGELLLPFWGNGVQEFQVKLGLRYDEWDAFDGDTTWQVGLEFEATQELKLRGTIGTVFRAPTINDLFQGAADNFPTFSDPCAPPNPAAGCEGVAPGDEAQLLARVGGNPFLIPETGTTYTGGLVWTPTFGEHHLTATLDYWQIDLEDGISSLGVQFILEDCYVNLNQASCDLITRRPADYGIQQVLDGPLNVSEQGAKGVDTEIRWNYESSIGQWEAAWLWSHLLERTKTPFLGAPEQDLSGRSTDPTAEDGGTYAQDKWNMTVQWAMGDLSIGYLGEFISGLDADTFCNCGAGNQPDGTYIQDIDSKWYHDLVASYAFSDYGLTVSGGITNLTDEEPPFIEVGFNATTDPATYRLFGRGYFMKLGWKF